MLNKIGIFLCFFLVNRCLFCDNTTVSKVLQESSDIFSTQKCISDIYKSKKASVAVVKAFSQKRKVVKIASGFFVTHDTLISNATILADSEELLIECEDDQLVQYSVICLGYDLLTNIAILRLNGQIRNVLPISLEEKVCVPEISNFVLNISKQQGLNVTPILGMITGVNISYGDTTWPIPLFRTNIPSICGESGSPVFDLKGNFCGIIIASLPEIQSSFILPAKALNKIYNDILYSGKVKYGYTGLGTKTIIDEISQKTQVCIEEISKNSPAEKAKLKPGDVILKIGGTFINSHNDLVESTFFTYPEQNLILKILRKDKEIDVQIKIEEHKNRAQTLETIKKSDK